MKNPVIKSLIYSATFLLVSTPVLAAKNDSFGDLLGGHATDEAGKFFSFIVLAFAFVGFVCAAVCMFGVVMIKMYPNSPATQKFESAGIGGLTIGAVVSAFLMVFSTSAYFFIGTAVGSGADTSALDKLKTGSVIEYRITPPGTELAALNHLPASGSPDFKV